MTDPRQEHRQGQRRERLFFALWPAAEFARQIYRAGSGPLGGLDGRRMPAEQLHITLRFMGAVDNEARGCLIDAASGIVADHFSLRLETLGYWAKPKVVWLGPAQPPPELLDLVRQLEAICQACGLEPEKRDYHPHMTLLRKTRHGPGESVFQPQNWAVADFALVRSETLPEGARYTVLQRWPLKGE